MPIERKTFKGDTNSASQLPIIRFSTPEITDPIDLPEGAKAFLNLVGVVPTNLEKEEFMAQLKIEEELGRDDDDDEE